MSRDRRDFLKISLAAGAYSVLSSHTTSLFLDDDTVPILEYSIENGRVFHDNKLQELYVGIDKNGALHLSSEKILAKNYIDASGKVVSPGFIDILADNSSNPETTYKIFESYKVTDGVTTALQLHGGHHKASYYYSFMERRPHYINYGVSTKVMNVRRSYGSITSRIAAVERNLKEGAIAVSHSIEYQPTPFSELLEYGKVAKKYNRPFFLHLRYSSEAQELEGVMEAIEIARQTGCKLHIDHLNSTGGTFDMEGALKLIRDARTEGLDITTCVYPYSYWATYVHSTRFNKGWKERYGLTYSDLTVVGTGEKLNASSFYKYRQRAGVLVAVPEGTVPMDKTVNLALKEEFCLIGSDGGIERSQRANNHPRGAGCFATSIKHLLSLGFSLEDAIRKVCYLPTQLVYPVLSKKGMIENGYDADLVIFDPETINGEACPANPNLYSNGIDYVFVNGKIAVQNKELKATNGHAIKLSV
ncbi:MAG: amidohydrolase family protein [Crocinitomicaceae bacterium]|nr:amidohydrolase family protein [Crocinitomicaceae bacterium]